MNTEVQRFFEMLGRRWIVVLIVFVAGSALLPVAAKTLPTYTASADLLIVNEALKDTTLSDPDLPAILTSTEVLSRVIDRLGLKTDPTTLAKKVKTKLPAKSSILELTYQDKNGFEAANVANAIADEATTYFHEIATRGYTEILQALNEQIESSQSRYSATNKLLQRAYEADLSVSSDKAVEDLSAQVDQLRAQTGQLGASLAADRATANASANQLRKIDPIVHAEILQRDVVYQQLQNQVAKDVADLSSERASFRDSFPGLAPLMGRVQRERKQLKGFEAVAVRSGAGSSPSFTSVVLDGERAATVAGADQERLRAIENQLSSEKDRLRHLIGAGSTLSTLRAKRDAALTQYMALTQRLSAAEADAAQGASLGRLVVVSRAVPGRAVLPLTSLIALGIIVLAFAIAAAYAVEAFDRRLWGVREIERVYGRPVFVEVSEGS